MGYMGFKINLQILMVLTMIFMAPISIGYTDPRDVYAVNSLFAALGSPPLPGWAPSGGDPCVDAWQGVQCVNSNITGIILDGMNLGGELGNDLNYFASIITIDLSNNHIGGTIPPNLPPTIRKFFLPGNEFNGSIPASLALLTQLSDMTLNNNHLTGELPDAFQFLTGLINLDFSGNNLSGPLPPSLGNLSSLETLYLQDNHLSGFLDVLQALPLRVLNIENNLFSGPIPANLLSIPEFRKDGNPFNTSIIPSPPSLASSPSVLGAPAPEEAHEKQAGGPSTTEQPNSAKTTNFFTTKRIIWITIAAAAICVVIVSGLCLFISKCCVGRQVARKGSKRHEMGTDMSPVTKPKFNEPLPQTNNQFEKVPKEAVLGPRDSKGMSRSSPSRDELEVNVERLSKRYQLDKTKIDVKSTGPPPQPPPPPDFPTLSFPVEKIIGKCSIKSLDSSCDVKLFTIATLQQYTNSFSQENHIGEGVLGSVYLAEIPGGKPLAVKKLDTEASRQQSDGDFLELVSTISQLQHSNILKLVGYCVEHGQRLLAYEYCRNGTLRDALQLDDVIHANLSWNARIKIALGAARALEYLHEVCQPPVVHRNFTSANVLLDDELAVRVADCGLAPLMSTYTSNQMSGHGSGYGAPELELGNYNYRSDVYRFGVVMLELLTGRKSYDRSRPRGEQYLVRWAISQLHDIDTLAKMVDPSLNGAYPVKSLSRFADIISLCVQSEPEFRPPMSEIVENLLHMIQREPPNRSIG